MLCRIIINGVVQGIGFRPFVFNTAVKYQLKGFVLNRGDAGVEIQVQGDKKTIESFINDLKENKPILARYESFEVDLNPKGIDHSNYSDFKIAKSSETRGSHGYIPPDLPICDKCIDEMRTDPRRLNYPFTSCVDCGPRFTVITSLPYDRPRTVMDKFPFCPECLEDYTNPSDRRFHAQTTCCWNCGPRYFLLDKKGEIIIDKDEFKTQWRLITKLIDEGNIIAIKGIGGTHLACRTVVDEPILKLRTWKGARGDKPFAVMSPNISTIRSYAKCSKTQEELLKSLVRPIVLLDKNDPFALSPCIAPGLHNIGVLLPYSGIHVLITENVSDPAVIMTSGNVSNIPILINNKEIEKHLSTVADYILLHDREIYQRADDSVLRVHSYKGTEIPLRIRRSRGYVPEPVELTWTAKASTVLALGAEMYNIGAIGLNNRCFPTQHIGHMTTLENVEFFNTAVNHLKKLLGVENFEALGGDLHPQFQTTQMGHKMSKELGIPFYQFQHHYSHMAGLIIDNKVSPDEDVICVTLDGTGYGQDGNIWGGEILMGNLFEYKRLAHLENQILLGGDLSVRQPYRILLAILLKEFSLDEIEENFNKIPWLDWIPKRREFALLGNQITRILDGSLKTGFNLTSSCGRLLDSISILLGVTRERTYEGEPAIKLESFAEKSLTKSSTQNIPIDSFKSTKGEIIIDTTSFVLELYQQMVTKHNRSQLALSSEISIAQTFGKLASELALSEGINKIGLSGGVCYNSVIFREFYKTIDSYGVKVQKLFHKNIPCGDGGIAIGQIPLIQSKLF
ncbi:MAG: carbamoyltransferase HypF [Candidatus Hodarchaeales archaeon]